MNERFTFFDWGVLTAIIMLLAAIAALYLIFWTISNIDVVFTDYPGQTSSQQYEGWVCPRCRKANAPWVSSCNCNCEKEHADN